MDVRAFQHQKNRKLGEVRKETASEIEDKPGGCSVLEVKQKTFSEEKSDQLCEMLPTGQTK